LNKNSIKNYIVSYINQKTAGEIVLTSINFSPLHHFPALSVRLNEVEIYEAKLDEPRLIEPEFCILNKFYISLDVTSLIRGDLNLSELSLEVVNLM
jgi:hypothetical protein